MRASRCENPLAPAVLADYWLADLAATSEERVEEHLFACESCSRELQGLTELIEVIRDLTRKGLLRVNVTEPFLERLRSEGLAIRQYDVNPGGAVDCTITPKDDLVIARLAADMAGAQRVDIVRCDAEGREEMRIHDIPLTGTKSHVAFIEPTDVLRALPKSVLRLRLVAVEETRERVLGDYTFNHTPSL